MKRILKNRLFIVIITLMIGISGTLYATTKYQVSDVLYNPSDGESMTVNEALDNLYNNKENISEISVTDSGSRSNQIVNFSNGEKEALIVHSLSVDDSYTSLSVSVKSYSNCIVDLIVDNPSKLVYGNNSVIRGQLYVWHITNIEENASITFAVNNSVSPYAIIKIK